MALNHVDLNNEYLNYNVVNILADKMTKQIQADVIKFLKQCLNFSGYTFSSDVEFFDFCKKNVLREVHNRPYPHDYTSYYLHLENEQYKTPKKLFSIVMNYGFTVNAVSYSVEFYN